MASEFFLRSLRRYKVAFDLSQIKKVVFFALELPPYG